MLPLVGHYFSVPWLDKHTIDVLVLPLCIWRCHRSCAAILPLRDCPIVPYENLQHCGVVDMPVGGFDCLERSASEYSAGAALGQPNKNVAFTFSPCKTHQKCCSHFHDRAFENTEGLTC